MSGAEHCPGCRGWTADWQAVCPGLAQDQAPGITPGVTVTRTAMPRLSWRDRLRVLYGRRLTLRVQVLSYRGGRGGPNLDGMRGIDQ